MKILTRLKRYKIPYTIQNGNITINQNINLANKKSMPDLPDNLTINGEFNLTNTYIKELPKNFTVNGSLHLVDTFIEKLPDNLTVNGDLNFGSSMMYKIKLPDNLIVNGQLFPPSLQFEYNKILLYRNRRKKIDSVLNLFEDTNNDFGDTNT